MAQPSSSHHDRDESRRHRSERSSHHHHRTISSTTLLLVLSLILAVLAVMLSLPSSTASQQGQDPAATGLWGYLTPKRSQALVARESSVAMREADVARREAELLAGAPGGVIPSQSPIICPACPTVMAEPAIQTIIKEVVKEQEALVPTGWWKEAGTRAEELLDRELRIAEREREMGKREEAVNRREHDASRRETWIMEQLIALGNDSPQSVEEEYLYEPAGAKRKPKALPQFVVSETTYETETKTVFHTLPPQTVTVPAPANTRLAAFPTPHVVSSSATTTSPRTTAVDIIVEDEQDPEEENEEDPFPVNVRRTHRPPARWFGGW